MKKILSSTLLIFTVCVLFLLTACNTVEKTGAWESATYRRDVELGNGSKTVVVQVRAEEQSVTFTIHTDKETLADALSEHGLISGEQGPYGLYVKAVNGVTADYDKDRHYWALYQNGEYLMTGVDSTVISDGEHYELVRERG